MAGIDSILRLVLQQGADELRVGTDVPPKMFQAGAQKRLAIPATSDETLRHLLGPILSAENEAIARRDGKVELTYAPEGGPAFHTVVTSRGGEPPAVDVIFVLGPKRAAPPPAPPAAEPAPPSRERPPAEPTAIAPPPSLRRGIGRASPALASLVSRATALGASDLHLAQGEFPRIRVDGALRPLADEPASDVLELLGDLFDDAARRRLDSGRSVDLAIDVASAGRVRVNVYRATGGLAAAARVLARHPPTIPELRLPVPIDDVVDYPHGLVIVCGPTGSGKSTTIAALADEALRRRSALLVTLEDPIEHVLEGGSGSLVRQRQVGVDVADFATGLRDALREDPDLLLVGEMRDPESIGLALTAAETGHLVLTTLHSRSATSAIERIVDAVPSEQKSRVRVQLADSLRAVVAQRLLPRARGGGRVVALEVLRVNHAVASLIREGKTAQIPTAIQSSRKEGMMPLERSLADLARSGQITREQAAASANDPAALASYLA